MNPVHQCEDISDTVPLFPVKGLFLKPISRIHASVHYPQLKQSLNNGGKTVSSWEIMEKLKALLAPDKFISIRVVKNTLEFIRFEGDLENRNVMKTIMGRLEGKSIKITGFKDPMKIRVAEAKIPFPSKYDWDSFFRDAKNMNEMKAGERPDTIHLQNLPRKWFSDRSSGDEKSAIPSEKLFRRIWDNYGDIRSIDIPLADPYRTQMQPSIAGIKTFTFSSDSVFEAYVQYKDYMSFVKAMDALRGSYILYQESSKYWVANVKVDFDKSKHLSEESIRRRKQERDRLMEKEKKEKMAAAVSKLEENDRNRREIQEKKKETDKNQANLDYKIAKEERKYIIARRKLESIRLMDFLFERLKKKLKDSKRARNDRGETDSNAHLHEKIMGKYKLLQENRLKEQHERLTEYRNTKRRRHSRDGGDYRDDYYEDDRRSRSASQNRSHSRGRSRSHSHSHYSNRSRSGHGSRSRSRSRTRSRSRSKSRQRERSRSRSGDHRSRSRGRSRTRSRERSRSRSRSLSRRSRSRSRTRSRSRSRDRSPHGSHSGSQDKYYRRYPNDKRPYDGHHKYYDNDDKRDYHHHGDDRYRHHDSEYRGRGRGHYMHRPPRGGLGYFHPGDGDGGRGRPFRGRGRGSHHHPSRYIGDWEFRDRDNAHSNPNLIPIHHHDQGPPPPPPHHHHHGPPPHHPEYFRGRGSFRGRGRGRGGYYNAQPHENHHYRNHRDDHYNNDDGGGPVVQRDFSYLEELDRAYEKYFKRITDTNKAD